MDEDGRAFGKLLVDRGLLTAQAMEEVLRERGGAADLVELLATRAGLSPEQRDALQREAIFSEIRTALVEASWATTALLAASAPFAPPGYELLGEIGRGAMGVVYRARQVALDRVVALKVMVAQEMGALRALERFQRESKVVARLHHPHIVEVLDVGSSGPVHFFAMRLVEGASLSHRLRERKFAPREAMDLARKVALALEHAHARGVIHRDVKPSNILIDANGEPHLVDFGLARDLGAAGMTAPGAFLGTPSYASPEQVGGQQVGPRGDVYSLGATLYEMLTGRPPFVGTNALSTLMAAVEGEVPPPRRWNPSTPRDAEAICLRAMERDPERRYATAGEMARDIERFLRGESVQARSVSLADVWMRRARRHRAAVAAVIAAGLVVAVLVVHVGKRHADARDLLVQARQAESHALRCEEREARRIALGRARDALAGALAMRPEDEEARAALHRVEAGLSWIDREIAAERDASARRAAEAEELFRKSALVSEVFQRWGRLREALREIERVAYDGTMSPAQVMERIEARWPEFEAFVAETPSDSASQAAMKALAGWAWRLGGREAEGWAMMEEAACLDPDIPYGALLEVLACFAEWAEAQNLRRVVYEADGPVFDPPEEEPPPLRALRERMKDGLARVRAARLWGREGAEDLADLVRAIEAAQAGDAAAAEAGLTRSLDAADLRFFETGLYLARAQARYYLAKWDDAVDDLARVARARPHQNFVYMLLDFVALGGLAAAERQGGDPRPFLDRALALTEEALATGPDASIRRTRARLWFNRARWENEQGMDPSDSLQRAIAECEEGLRIEPEDPLLRYDLALYLDDRGDAEAALGQDPTRSYEASLSEIAGCIARDPEGYTKYYQRSLTLYALATWEMKHAIDSRPRLKAAQEDCRKVLELRPEFTAAWWQLGALSMVLGSYEEAATMYERSLPRDREPTAIERANIEYARGLAREPLGEDVSRWLAAAAQGALAMERRDYARAKRLYEGMLSAAARSPGIVPEGVQAEARLALERIRSLPSGGGEPR